MTDKIKGGRADNKKSSDFDAKQLKIGTDHEMEHTKDSDLAREIAMDHLAEDPQYYVKLKEIEKYDRVEEEADGKKELDYGKEDLDKRWSRLKKALSSDEAVLDMSSQEYQDEEEQPEEQPEEEVQEDEQSPEIEPAEEEDIQPDQDDNPSEEEVESDPGQAGSDELGEGDVDTEQLAELLRQEGYSEAEVGYIVHNHMLPQSTTDDIKMDGEKQSNAHDQDVADHELEHKKRMSDLEFDTASKEQGINELDRDHKKRMLDLEFETAKKEKEMELQFKEKELALKLQNQKEKATHQLKAKKDADRSRSMDAAKTSAKEKAGK